MDFKMKDEIEGDLELTVLCRFKCGAVRGLTAPVALSEALLISADKAGMDAETVALCAIDMWLECEPGTAYKGHPHAEKEARK